VIVDETEERRDGGAMPRVLGTGASRGIAHALVAEPAGRGLEVVATARRVDNLADLPAAQRLPLDVISEASVAAAVKTAGPIDLLINNAAVRVAAPVEDTPAKPTLAMFDTHVVRPLWLISALPRECGSGRRNRGERVVGARAGGIPLNGVHAASKHPLEALSEALAVAPARSVPTSWSSNSAGRHRNVPEAAALLGRLERRLDDTATRQQRRDQATSSTVLTISPC
jgi:NAD(P)-dependent dehydrogenase (short-subunit alcohol dehydrogenase family)